MSGTVAPAPAIMTGGPGKMCAIDWKTARTVGISQRLTKPSACAI